MDELRPDLTISEIDAVMDEGEVFEHEYKGRSYIMLDCCEPRTRPRPVPASWLKPKVKKWIATNVGKIKKGDVILCLFGSRKVTWVEFFPGDACWVSIVTSDGERRYHPYDCVMLEVEE